MAAEDMNRQAFLGPKVAKIVDLSSDLTALANSSYYWVKELPYGLVYKNASGTIVGPFDAPTGVALLAGGNVFTGAQTITETVAATTGVYKIRNTAVTVSDVSGTAGALFDTNTMGYFAQYTSNGGVQLVGATNSLSSFAIIQTGYLPSGTVTGAANLLVARKYSGSGNTAGAIDNAEDAWRVNNHTTSIASLKGNGDLTISGKLTSSGVILAGTASSNATVPSSSVVAVNTNVSPGGGLLVRNSAGGNATLARFDLVAGTNLGADPRFATTVGSSAHSTLSGIVSIGSVDATEFRIETGKTGGSATTSIFIRPGGTTVATFKTSGRVNIPLTTYADDTAAGVAGLVAGDYYKLSTGQVMIKL